MDIQNFMMLGISHEELSLEEREAFFREKPQQLIQKAYQEGKIQAYVNVSTCLRLEFYLHGNTESLEELQAALPFATRLQSKRGLEALDYLAHVICGFASVIKGEDQILAQIRKAYQDALESGHSSKLCNIIFQKMIELGKQFRAKSQIAHHALSLEAITLQCLREEFPDWKEKNIFLLGVGDLSQAILALLVKEGCPHLYVSNRSFHKAMRLKEIYEGVHVVDYKEKYEAMARSEIIISATSAPHLVIEKEKFQAKQEDKNYCFLDLAVPRDVDPSLAEEEKIDIINLDDLWEISRAHGLQREQLLEDYHYLLDDQIAAIEKSLAYYQKGGRA